MISTSPHPMNASFKINGELLFKCEDTLKHKNWLGTMCEYL